MSERRSERKAGGVNVAAAFYLRLRRVNFVGPVQATRMQDTEVFPEGEGVKASRIRGDVRGIELSP